MDALEPQSQTPAPPRSTSPRAAQGRAFSITELLVVIAIIVLLAALLVVAMGKVRESSLRTSTLSTMQNFGRAADAFQMEHGFYPGVIPENVLAEANRASIKGGSGFITEVGPQGVGKTTLASTENALLHLMGGYRVCPPGTPGCSKAPGTPTGDSPMGIDFNEFDIGPNGREFVIGEGASQWLLKINFNEIGQGPIINGKPYAPYYTPSPNEVFAVRGQGPDNIRDAGMPDLVDAWGMPVQYTRRVRSSGPLVGKANPGKGEQRPQFVMGGMMPYFSSTQLGERGLDQTGRPHGSIFFDTDDNAHKRFAQVIRHPSFGSWDIDPLDDENRGRIAPRGEYVLISAGPNGIFFSRSDGPGTATNYIGKTPQFDILPPQGKHANPRAISSFSDIVIFGGG